MGLLNFDELVEFGVFLLQLLNFLVHVFLVGEVPSVGGKRLEGFFFCCLVDNFFKFEGFASPDSVFVSIGEGFHGNRISTIFIINNILFDFALYCHPLTLPPRLPAVSPTNEHFSYGTIVFFIMLILGNFLLPLIFNSG